MSIIVYEEPETWVRLVEAAIENPEFYRNRLKNSGIEYCFWDCSSLGGFFNDLELRSVFCKIEDSIFDHSIRLFHGCRLDDCRGPFNSGLQISSMDGIVNSLTALAKTDNVLKKHVRDIEKTVNDPFYQEQSGYRNGQIWFGLTEREIVEEGGVYVAFGSEFRLLILNSIDESLKYRLFCYGKPSIVAVDLPVSTYLSKYSFDSAKFLLSLWINHTLGLNNGEILTGYACYLEQDIPARYVADIIHPEKVQDNFNRDGRWYALEEIYLKTP